jgi:ABC-2 type transport system permease protein
MLLLSLVRLRALLAKEFRQLLRDPRMAFFVIVPPLVQLIVFGYAATYDVRYAEVAVVDYARTPATRALLADVTSTGRFDLRRFADMETASDAMDRNEIRVIMRLPADFDQSRVVQLVADGSDSNSALMVLGQLSGALRTSVRQSVDTEPPVRLEERAWFNPNLEDRAYFVPGIIANVVLVATMILAAMTVVREREMGTLERLMVTPIARLEFIIAKIIPVGVVGMIDVFLVTAVAVFWFDVPFRGSVSALLLGSMLYLMSTLGLGLLVSSYSKTQQQAMLLAFFIIMPATTLSGFAFPIGNMPELVQPLAWINPLTYYLIVVRDVFLKGGTLGDHLLEFGAMGLLGAISLGISLLRVRTT